MQSTANYQTQMLVQQKPSMLTSEKLEEIQCVRRRALPKIKTKVSSLRRNSLNDLIVERRKALVMQTNNNCIPLDKIDSTAD